MANKKARSLTPRAHFLELEAGRYPPPVFKATPSSMLFKDRSMRSNASAVRARFCSQVAQIFLFFASTLPRCLAHLSRPHRAHSKQSLRRYLKLNLHAAQLDKMTHGYMDHGKNHRINPALITPKTFKVMAKCFRPKELIFMSELVQALLYTQLQTNHMIYKLVNVTADGAQCLRYKGLSREAG